MTKLLVDVPIVWFDHNSVASDTIVPLTVVVLDHLDGLIRKQNRFRVLLQSHSLG